MAWDTTYKLDVQLFSAMISHLVFVNTDQGLYLTTFPKVHFIQKTSLIRLHTIELEGFLAQQKRRLLYDTAGRYGCLV
ncbi:hypothetical protein ANCDUO_12615 [Ancylostoma duodenale]|uniref:Uncharacterized protein n=1 Tax=Ancylostoma duodenale TaxID=51022 RepID=A0A0C2G874_9BILA|nr:hypothetical protein ANCDUO_12615 [Ancylostoma duodenale]